MRWWVPFAALLIACVAADDSPGSGSVQYTFVPSVRTTTTFTTSAQERGWAVTIDRAVFGFKTMTVGKIGTPDLCSYRGRGAASDVVFDANNGVVQTFNGIAPVLCPDVGMIFGVVDNDTVPFGATDPKDLLELAEGGYHALVDATIERPGGFDNSGEIQDERTWKVQFRFEPTFTATRFGGCHQGSAGVRILENQRKSLNIVMAPENLFREAIGTQSEFRAAGFGQADEENGNDDGIVTMDELDQLPLYGVDGSYQLPTESGDVKGEFASLGDYVRFLFRFTMLYQSEEGLCVGNPPGETDPAAAADAGF